MTTKKQNAILWASQVTASVILLQVVVLKLLAVPEAVFLFDKLGLEPAGRIGSGALELIAAICLLSSRLSVIGALISLSVMLAAIYAHITKLGIVLMDSQLQLNDGGSLFALSVTVAVCSVITIILRKKVIDFSSPIVGKQKLA
ncbi:DoxX-like family protein [Flexibacter flexilis DSM 6793]|uniref:DoxX-like family protein n=1 Tax=Flexibacter flexilis DSM 6793 TaxID=927664 RepID=A0A1I1HFU5_9BACT|nr:DoxX family protein [Flexibacter flexilis]SFC19990.1 DoxX-like family protein [Flexibacter flexilis DSM 6793]